LENLCVKKKFISNKQSLEKIEFFLFNQAFIASGQRKKWNFFGFLPRYALPLPFPRKLNFSGKTHFCPG
jgi:hypothetical protein